jgi:hypothetical protein
MTYNSLLNELNKNQDPIGVSGRSNITYGSMLSMMGVSDI